MTSSQQPAILDATVHTARQSSGSDTDNLEESSRNGLAVSSLMASMSKRKPVETIQLSIENVTYAPLSRSIAQPKKKLSKELKSIEVENDNEMDDVVEIGEGRTVVLDSISVEVKPYRLTAWMGPSGSGKSSLIKIAAGLVPKGDIVLGSRHSHIAVNGSTGEIPKNMVSVVWQDDLLLSNLSVYETVEFAARLKTSSSIGHEEVKSMVDQVLSELGLEHVKNSLIGGGISGGERKRVSVAVELVGRPSVLLLDEPTSGLDATSALHLMQTLKDLTNLGHSVVAVVHQPRTKIFDLIDDLLLLSKGKVAYSGEARFAKEYLESVPGISSLPPQTGIADWIMDSIDVDQKREEPQLGKAWAELDQKTKQSFQNHDRSKVLRRVSSLKELKNNVQKYQVGFWTQLRLLVHRSMKQRRGEKLTTASLLVTLAYIFFTSLFWWQLPDTTDRIFERGSLMFFIIVAQSNRIVTEGVTVFQQERRLVARERAKKLYETLPYFIANSIADGTSSILLPCLYGCIVYWTSGLRPSAAAFFTFELILYLTVSAAQSMGLFLSIAIPNLQISLMLAPLLTLLLIILGGFYIPIQNMNVAIRWASWISMARYGFQGFIINEFQGRTIECNHDTTLGVNFADNGVTCPVNGDDVIISYGIEGMVANVWVNVAFLILLQVVLRSAAFVLLKRTI